MNARLDPVGTEELKDALLQTIVERFGDRPIDWFTCEMAFAFALFEIKQAALFAPTVKS